MPGLQPTVLANLAMAGAVKAAKVGQVTGDLVQVAQDALDALGPLGLVIDPLGH